MRIGTLVSGIAIAAEYSVTMTGSKLGDSTAPAIIVTNKTWNRVASCQSVLMRGLTTQLADQLDYHWTNQLRPRLGT